MDSYKVEKGKQLAFEAGMMAVGGAVSKGVSMAAKTAPVQKAAAKVMAKAEMWGAGNHGMPGERPGSRVSVVVDGPKVSATTVEAPKISPTKVVQSGAENAKVVKADMGEYRLTKGHHVHSKKAFEGHPNYDPKKGFAISQDLMKSKGWRHEDMTVAQQKLYKELHTSGRANTLQEHTRIAVEALQNGGATRQEARDIVSRSLNQLRKDGVIEPMNIPWYSKQYK